MKFFVMAAFLAGALAVPTEMVARNDGPVCPNGLYSNPVCANVDVLGILCLDASAPIPAPHSADDFEKVCASIGKQARCAVVPIANQAILCQKPAGVK